MYPYNLYVRPKEERSRFLGSRIHVAHTNQGPCQQCQMDIQAGDQYERGVSVRKGKISVYKVHVNCPDDWYRRQDAEVDHANQVSNQTTQPSSRQQAA